MDRCTGTPTSTFGGGGGTKLFCSQALNATHANAARTIRGAATALCEREGIIPVPQSFYFNKQFLFQQTILFGRSMSSVPHSNNLLAEEPETENDAAARLFGHPFQDFTSVEAAQATTIGIS